MNKAKETKTKIKISKRYLKLVMIWKSQKKLSQWRKTLNNLENLMSLKMTLKL